MEAEAAQEPSTSARGADELCSTDPGTFLSPEQLEHIRQHKPFTPQQLQELKDQIEQYQKLNTTLREARKQHFVLRVISFNNERRLEALSRRRGRGRGRRQGSRKRKSVAMLGEEDSEEEEEEPRGRGRGRRGREEEEGSSEDSEAEEELERRLKEADKEAEEEDSR